VVEAGARWPELVFADEHTAQSLSRAVQRQTLRRLARGIYTGVLDEPLEAIAARQLVPIVAHEFPGAVIVDRSAFSGGRPGDGVLYLAQGRGRRLELPGLTIDARRGGVSTAAGEMPMPHGLALSTPARTMLDGLALDPPRGLSDEEIEDWIDRLARDRGPAGLNRLRDQARALAPLLRRGPALRRLNRLISAALTTGDAGEVRTPGLAARADGHPWDARRVAVFTDLARALRDTAPETLPALPGDAPRRRLLPFYEAYFSNYIEGTEFTIDEAAAIVFDGAMPEDRPQDAHDIVGAYELVADPIEMSIVPRTADELLGLLKRRHATLMAARPDTRPGEFKQHANRAGGTEFVAPDLVVGTLREGFTLAGDLVDPFQRAVYMMFLVAEVHPFVDGNGRTARIMMNAELLARGEVPIIVPTVYRLNYLSALRAVTHNEHFQALYATLEFARRFTARVDFTSRETAEADLERTNAFRDPQEAEQAGVRLLLP